MHLIWALDCLSFPKVLDFLDRTTGVKGVLSNCLVVIGGWEKKSYGVCGGKEYPLNYSTAFLIHADKSLKTIVYHAWVM